MSPVTVLIVAFGSAALVYLAGKVHARLRDSLAVLSTLLLVGLIGLGYGAWRELVYVPDFLGVELVLRLNPLAWFFAIATASLSALCIIFSLSYMRNRERTDFYYSMMLLVNAGMLGVVLAGDFVSFFIFWEIMSWSTFLLISYNRGLGLAAGMKYIIASIIGSGAMLLGMLSLYTTCGTLHISNIPAILARASSGYIVFILIIFGIAFGIKNAVVPLHTWLPDSYADAPSPFTAVLSGMLTRMGMYGFLLIMYVIAGVAGAPDIGSGTGLFKYVLAWLGAVTIVIPTFIAMLQNDAKRLLAWHGIGQGGYMVLGIALGTSLGVAGGVFHTLNHAIYIVLLFMSVGAVQYRTQGERDLNSLGGLVSRMPIAFMGGLLGICGLIGVPLTNGFVSKWLIYKALIIGHYPFLAFAALVGTWGTILSVYKFLHNMFLGQLPEKYREVRRSPFSMQLPIIVLSVAILLFGILPGIPLSVIQSIQEAMGFEALRLTPWGLASEAGALNMLNICFAIVIAFVAVFLLMRLGAKGRRVPQEDSYAAGAAVPADKYHHTVDFYDPLYRMISPYLKDRVDQFYYWLAAKGRGIADRSRRMYTGYTGTYVFYIVSFLALLIFLQLVWHIW